MIISRTPYRISFFGGGTDYPDWYRRNGGAVLATTINKYCYITVRYLPPFFENKYRVAYARVEDTHTIDEILHPAVREVLRYLNMERGVAIGHDGDLPARGGMGSSSSFTVGLLNAMYALKGHMPSKMDLATEAIYVEQERLRETVGSQDQVQAAFGGFNQLVFDPSGSITVRPITLAPDRMQELNAHLMLFYTGIKRTASNVAESYVGNLQRKEEVLRLMRDMVDEGISILQSQDINRFGKLLHEAWRAKRGLGDKITNSDVEQIYEAAMAAGALGGKLLGAGGGGFMVLFVRPQDQNKVLERLNNLIYVPFKFEHNGSSIIFFDPETDYAFEESLRNQQALRPFRELFEGAPGAEPTRST